MANLNMARLSAYPVFLAVYEERRLVKAAERLCVTPSAVSHALRDFEKVSELSFLSVLLKVCSRRPQASGSMPKSSRSWLVSKRPSAN